MRLTEEQMKLVEQAVQKHVPSNADLYAQAEKNPEFVKAREATQNAPLVPQEKMKQFISGMAVLTNKKALNGLYKKTNVYGKNPTDISTAISSGMQIWTKTLANASAALVVAHGDKMKEHLASNKSVNEQAEADDAEFLNLVNRAQKNAATYLMGNKVTKQDTEDVKPMSRTHPPKSPDPFKIPEGKIREQIRKRVSKILNGKK